MLPNCQEPSVLGGKSKVEDGESDGRQLIKTVKEWRDVACKGGKVKLHTVNTKLLTHIAHRLG